VLILSEKLTLNFLLGAGVVLTGILLTQRPTHNRPVLKNSPGEANAGIPASLRMRGARPSQTC